MKPEKQQPAGSGEPLLRRVTPETEPDDPQSARHAGLATAVCCYLFPSGSRTRSMFTRIVKAWSEKPVEGRESSGGPHSTSPSGALQPAGRGDTPLTDTAGEREMVKPVLPKLPVRLILAVLMLIAAIITGFFAPHPPL